MTNPYRGSFGVRTSHANAERSQLAHWLRSAGKSGMSAVELDECVERCALVFSTSWRTLIREMVQARPFGDRWYWGAENLPDQGSPEVQDCVVQPAEFAGGHRV